MSAIFLVIHIVIAAALVGVILIQRSEGGALGGLGGSNMGGVMTGRSTANLLTRTTAILAALFIATSLALAIFAGHTPRTRSLLDELPAGPAAAPAPAAPEGNATQKPSTAAPAPQPAAPSSGPQAPVAQ
ncbi:protein translocase subunit secG [Arboricoccus pini]|uniref:Protein-export membrane protein SecG n=1 Tax=Arboricoccus pini TaxID=1963835 RepID=A0A212QNW3_9PROT|nr:preprotein translocase subunit SecG [Arboricoccus pini]SNB61146.1 protein translocase subunit secG [Arboricoccus pini]